MHSDFGGVIRSVSGRRKRRQNKTGVKAMKSKHTKKALLMSVLSMLMCMAIFDRYICKITCAGMTDNRSDRTVAFNSTIRNRTITNASPLFEGGFAGNSGIVIKDLTIADSNITADYTTGLGAFVSTADSMTIITLENCKLLNSSVKGNSGARAGGLIG